jgi:hypothetical protein
LAIRSRSSTSRKIKLRLQSEDAPKVEKDGTGE